MRFTTKALISAILAILITLTGYALVSPQDDKLRAAFELLLKADAVKDRAVGYAGITPEEYKAFEALWNAGKAAEAYALKLVSDGTPAGRVYGAILLLKLDEAAARQAFPKLKEEKDTIEIWRGCIIMQETIGALVRQLEQGNPVIITPGDRPVRRK